jgi:hypothetical protein
MIHDKLSRQLYETIYPVVADFRAAGFPPHQFNDAWRKFIDETIDIFGEPAIDDQIDQELRLKHDGAYYEGEIRFKSESAVTMFLLRFA